MAIQARNFTFFEPYEGHVRTLKFDMNALSDFEQETGMGFGQLMQQKAIFAVVRGLLWAGFQHEDRRITVRQVGDLIQEYVSDEARPDNGIEKLLAFAYEVAQEHGAFGRAEDFRKKALAAAGPKAVGPAPVSHDDIEGHVLSPSDVPSQGQ
jgi:hypothetical protein